VHRIVAPAAVALLSLWSSISISPATTPSLASTRWIASSVAPRRTLASRPSLHLRANPLAPVQNVTGQLIAILSRPSPGSIVTIVRRDGGVNVVGRCRPVATRCSVTWASATNGTAHLEAYWSLSTRVRPVVVRLTLQVHPAGALIYAVQQGHRLGPLVRVLVPPTPAQLAGAHSAGGASLSASRMAPGLCASGRKVLLYRDVATVPGEVVLVAPGSGPRCPPATWITPQEPTIAPSQTRAGKAGDPITLAGSFPAAPAAPAAALFFAGPRPTGSAPIQGWTLHRLRTRIGFALTPGRYSVRVGWYDPLTGRMALSSTDAAVRVTAPLPVVVSPHTRVLTAASDASLRQIVQLPETASAGIWTLVFVHPTAQVRALRPGNVLVSGPAPSLPHGVLRKITGVVVNGETVNVATSPATLSDVFMQGAIHLNIPLQPSAPTGTVPAPHTLAVPLSSAREAAYPTDESGNDLKMMSKNGFCLQAEVSVPLVRSRDELVSWPGARATFAVNGNTFNVSTPPLGEPTGGHTSREVALKASATGCLTNAQFHEDIVLIPGHVTTGQWDLSLCYNDQADCPAVIQIGYPNGIVGPTPVGSKSILGDWRSKGEISIEAGRTGHADLSVIHHVPNSIAGHQWELYQQELGAYWGVIGGVPVEATPYLDWTFSVAGDASIAASMKVENRAHIQWGVTCVQQAGQQCYSMYSPPVVAKPVPSQPEPQGLNQERPAFDATVSSKLSIATGPSLGLKFYDSRLLSAVSADIGAQFGATLSYTDEKVLGGEHTITIAADADLSLKGGIHPLANEDWGLVNFEFPLRHWPLFSHTFHITEEPPKTAPHITSVDFSGAGPNLHFVVHGSGFGPAPVPMPYTGDISGITFYFDDITHDWTGGDLSVGVTLRYISWTDSEIVVDGFSGGYGANGWVDTPGDHVSIRVTNVASGKSTSWEGRLPPSPTTQPHITSVDFSNMGQNLHFVVHGSGFGAPPASMPFTGNVPNERFYFYDLTNNWTGGHGTDGVNVKYESWSDNNIVADGFAGGYGCCGWVDNPGDAVRIGVGGSTGINPAIWNGHLPIAPTPHITSVHLNNIGADLQITVDGSGFGQPPLTMPYKGNSCCFYFYDLTNSWTAGHATDGINLKYMSWNDTQIVVDGFAGSYGCCGWVDNPNDHVAIGVRNPAGLAFTVWKGTLPPVSSGSSG